MKCKLKTQFLTSGEKHVIGIMSGTSLDGVDLALVSIVPKGSKKIEFKLKAFETFPFSTILRQKIQVGFTANVKMICDLHYELGRFFSDLVLRFLKEKRIATKKIDLLGSHGQTIYHNHGISSLQLGDADIIAKNTGIPVVFDFRAGDIAVGGSGAPLVPYFDELLFDATKESLALQNLGGIGNVTYLSPNHKTLAFDTGPANMILNELVEILTKGDFHFDKDANYSKRGKVIENILRKELKHPYFNLVLPKSTGREEFGKNYVETLLKKHAKVDLPDLLRTCVSLISHSIYQAYQKYFPPVDHIILSGGGIHHPILVAEIKSLFPDSKVNLFSEVVSISEDAKEAVTFAILAYQRICGVKTNCPEITGARQSVSLGKIALP